jgi:hypothetical protein
MELIKKRRVECPALCEFIYEPLLRAYAVEAGRIGGGVGDLFGGAVAGEGRQRLPLGVGQGVLILNDVGFASHGGDAELDV